MTEENMIRDTAEVVKGIVEAVPVYEDAIQPAVKELGKGIETIAKAVNVALAPIAALVWGYDQVKEFVSTRVAEKLQGVPPEQITIPDPTVAGPTLEALKYTGHQESLREMYANLLATSLDSGTAKNAHPAFVDIIKNMCPDEAKIMRQFSSITFYPIIDTKITLKENRGFIILLRNISLLGFDAGCQHPELCPNYLDNLGRLGLLSIPSGRYIQDDSVYELIKKLPPVLAQKEEYKGHEKYTFGIDRKKLEVTDLGKQFIKACVIDKTIGTEQLRDS